LFGYTHRCVGVGSWGDAGLVNTKLKGLVIPIDVKSWCPILRYLIGMWLMKLRDNVKYIRIAATLINIRADHVSSAGR
jgi:hypothetical protein